MKFAPSAARRACRALSVSLSLSILTMCLLGAPTVSRADTPEEQLQFASGLYAQKLWGLAADKLRAFVAAYPNHPRAKYAAYQLGGALYRAQNDKGEVDYAAAAAAYERALTKYPDAKLSAPARFELGDAYFNLKKYDKAVAAQTAFLKSNPPAEQAAQANYWLGESFYALNKRGEAQAAYQKVLASYPKSALAPYAQYSLGLLAADAGQHSAAANAFRAVLAKFPASEVAPESHLRLGDALLAAKQYGAARDAYQKTLDDARAAEWKTEARLGLADAQFGTKNWAGAAAAYEQAVSALKENDPRRAGAQLRQGDSLFNAKEYERALAAYAPLATSGNAKVAPSALYFSGNALRALNRFDEAANQYRELMTKFAGHALAPRAALRLGDSYADAKDAARAAEAYRVVLTKYPKSSAAKEAQEALVALAGEVTDAGMGKVAAGGSATNGNAGAGSNTALEQVLRALPPGPATSNAQLRLAQAAFEREDWPRATQLAQAALGGKPDKATAENALYLLASSQLRAGQAGASAASFRRQLSGHPRGALASQARLGLAWSLLDAKQWSEAAVAARAALSAALADAALRDAARLALGEALLKSGKTKEALPVFAVAEKSKNKEVAAQGARGAALASEAQKQWPGAAQRWAKVAALSSDGASRARAFTRQGLALTKAKNGAAAMAAFERAVAAAPKGETAARTLYEAAWLARDLKQSQKESALWTRLATEFPDSPLAAEAAFQQGEALFAAKQWNSAATAYRRVTDGYAKSEVAPLAWYKLGSALYNAKSWSEAGAAFDRATALKSEVAAESLFWAGESWWQAESPGEARSRYEAFIKAAGSNNSKELRALLPSAHLGLGRALSAAGDWTRAATVFRAGLSGARGVVDAELNFRLGEALAQTGNDKAAATQFLKVAISHADSQWAPRAQWGAAQSLEKSGDKAGALAAYRALAARRPASDLTAQAQERIRALQ